MPVLAITYSQDSQRPVRYVSRMEGGERAQRLVDAYSGYATSTQSSHYDEVIEQVIARVDETGSLGKLDIGALTAWKRITARTKWMARLMSTSDEDVRAHTGRCVTAARDESQSVPDAAQAARAALRGLHGFDHGDALASTVCFAAAPHRLAVYDRRAHRGLDLLDLHIDNRSSYWHYMMLVEQCRGELATQGHDWSARQVDLAMYWLGG